MVLVTVLTALPSSAAAVHITNKQWKWQSQTCNLLYIHRLYVQPEVCNVGHADQAASSNYILKGWPHAEILQLVHATPVSIRLWAVSPEAQPRSCSTAYKRVAAPEWHTQMSVCNNCLAADMCNEVAADFADHCSCVSHSVVGSTVTTMIGCMTRAAIMTTVGSLTQHSFLTGSGV